MRAFRKTCDFPGQSLAVLENRDDPESVHSSCFRNPDQQKWDRFEWDMKGRPPSGPPAQNGWLQNNYKFRRNHSPNVQRVAELLAKFLEKLRKLHKTTDNKAPLVQFRGNFYYPAGGCREWHTNRMDLPGWRLYLIHNDPAESCQFHIYDEHNDETIRFVDNENMMRLFRVSAQTPLWHNIVSNGDRWSMGFAISDEDAENLKRHMKPRS